ncbi:MAG: ComEC/Rec2 family competence protein [bacterium]|nr:ComEC/Rec2 family competence protein [bacterium]
MRLVVIALGWTTGILLALNGQPFPPLIWLALAALLLVMAAFAWRDPDYRLLHLALVAFAFGGLRGSFVPTSSDIALYNNTGGLTIEGIISAEPDVRDERIQLRVQAEKVLLGAEERAVSGTVLVYAPSTTAAQYGDRVQATGLLYTPAEYDTFSYADYLARTGIFSIMDRTAVEVVTNREGFSPRSALIDLRRDAYDRISQALPEPQAGLLAGILLGDERGLSPELQDAFSAVGAAHIIAISGFNMAVISGLLTQSLDQESRRKWLRIVLAVGVLGVYTLFVGANAAVVRAAVMSSVLIIGQGLRRKTFVPASLAFVALLMSLQQPTVLYDLSFQLSFFATLSLALFATPLTNALKAGLARVFPPSVAAPVGGFLTEPLAVSLAALVLTLPLTIVYFSRLSVVTLLVNLLIVPVQAWLLILGGIGLILSFFLPFLGQFLLWVNLVFLSWTIGVVRAFAGLSFADTEVRVEPELIILYFALVLGIAFMSATQPSWWLRFGRFLRRRAVFSVIVFSGVSLTLLMSAVTLGRPDGRLHVWFLDLGHSNAVLAQTPGGAQILVDGGRFPSRLLTALGDRMPFTDREIEVLAITHPDEFDLGALTAVLERYEVGVVLTNGQPNQSEFYAGLEAAVAEHEVVIVQAGYTLNLSDGTRLEVLHPTQQPSLGDSIEDHVLTLRLSYDDISFLLSSDLSVDGQAALLENGEWPLATVLQLPQHGTARSLNEAFLTAVQPQAVVVQSDRANRRGDPNPDVLARLGSTPLFRTDQDGVIHLVTDGTALFVLRR